MEKSLVLNGERATLDLQLKELEVQPMLHGSQKRFDKNGDVKLKGAEWQRWYLNRDFAVGNHAVLPSSVNFVIAHSLLSAREKSC